MNDLGGRNTSGGANGSPVDAADRKAPRQERARSCHRPAQGAMA